MYVEGCGIIANCETSSWYKQLRELQERLRARARGGEGQLRRVRRLERVPELPRGGEDRQQDQRVQALSQERSSSTCRATASRSPPTGCASYHHKPELAAGPRPPQLLPLPVARRRRVRRLRGREGSPSGRARPGACAPARRTSRRRPSSRSPLPSSSRTARSTTSTRPAATSPVTPASLPSSFKQIAGAATAWPASPTASKRPTPRGPT